MGDWKIGNVMAEEAVQFTPARFKVGDIVKLRSGGPAMTVVQVCSDKYHTVWFTSAGLHSSHALNAFPADALTKVRLNTVQTDPTGVTKD